VKVLLRITSVVLVAMVAFTALLVFRLTRDPSFLHRLLATGAFGYMTLIGWAVTAIAGVPAAVQLWRLRKSGLLGASVVFGTSFTYYALGLTVFRRPESAISSLVYNILFSSIVLVLLVSPPARRTCATDPPR
jgi:hypothetical protein